VNYTVKFPAKRELTRKDGSKYIRDDWFPSTAVEELGEISVNAAQSDAEQEATIKRKVEEWLQARPKDDQGFTILEESYELWLLDESRGLQYNKESIFVSPDGEAAVEAVLHRPLRQCLPWRFSNMPNISEHAFEETNNQCVPYQLSQCLKLYGGQEAYNEEQIMSELEKDIKTIYEDNFDNPYVSQTEKGIVQHNPREYGITPAVLINFCKRKRISCHILWKGKKIESHVPVNTEHRTIALYVWGDHAFFIEDNPKVKEHIAKMEQQIPKSMSEDVVEPLLNTVSGPDASTWQPWNGQIVSSAVSEAHVNQRLTHIGHAG
jgi:hypothetical protein